MPNKIFDEGLTPNEFVVYSFLTKAKDKRNQSYWSVPHMAHYCGICDTTCRKALSSLKEKGYIEISERYQDNVQQSNIYTVNRI
ncbi:MAG: helix-turn-helix domain-containing protein [Eubacterium sp.]|nr:helix-turn-helix domain-containing protein [Eubacterium sp.]